MIHWLPGINPDRPFKVLPTKAGDFKDRKLARSYEDFLNGQWASNPGFKLAVMAEIEKASNDALNKLFHGWDDEP